MHPRQHTSYTPAARAVQLYWLLLALVQDTPPSERLRLRQLEAFKEQVERAALDGNYVSVCYWAG